MLFDEVVQRLNMGSIPTIKPHSISNKIRTLYSTAQTLSKRFQSNRILGNFENELSKFKLLFDVSPCRCFDNNITRANCRCKVKIPNMELEFYCDQKIIRNQFIGGIDNLATAKIQARECREQQRQLQSYGNVRDNTPDLFCIENDEIPSEIQGEESDEDNDEFYPCSSRLQQSGKQNRFSYPHLCKVLDRFSISDTAGCAIANEVLQDLDLLTTEKILSRDKVRYQRKYWRRKEIRIRPEDLTNLTCIGFDGRKDETLSINNVEDAFGVTQQSRASLKEEHCVITSEPGTMLTISLLNQDVLNIFQRN